MELSHSKLARDVRERLGLSPQEFANWIEVSVAAIKSLERYRDAYNPMIKPIVTRISHHIKRMTSEQLEELQYFLKHERPSRNQLFWAIKDLKGECSGT